MQTIYLTGHVIQHDASRKNGPEEVSLFAGEITNRVCDLMHDYERRHGKCASFDFRIVK